MKIHRKFYFLIACAAVFVSLFLTAFSVRAQATGNLDIQSLDTYLQAQVTGNRIPGMAAAVVKDGRVLFQKGYGEAAAGKPVTPQTQFYIGSVTKSFTALAVMKLVEQGKLDLDLPVRAYIPWFKVEDTRASEQITVRHLLNHTSGLTEKGDPNAAAFTNSLEEQVRLLQFARSATPPGDKFEYYNQNYRVLGYVIEQVSGQSYGEFLEENIFLPLGMTHTVTHPDEAVNLAQGYSRFFGFPLALPQEFIPGGLPSGYLITTAEDMAAYMIGLLANRQLDGQPVLNPDLLDMMRTPPAGIDSSYGMGWMVAEDGSTLLHGGALNYFQSFVALDTKENSGFVALYNQNSMENMMFENSSINSDLVDFLNGKNPAPVNKAWGGLVLLAVALADLFNHVRLFRMLPHWVEKTGKQNRVWLWIKVIAGIVFPLAIVLGVPPLMNALEGGAPDWIAPFQLMPDIVTWLLLGTTLNFIRSALHAAALIRKPQTI